jgi:hypothetical protein
LSLVSQRGVVQVEAASQAPDGRRKVVLEGASKESKRIKEENLTLACSSCGKLEPAFRCSGCHGASYCSERCQGAHWPAHCAACDVLQASGQARLNDAASTNGKLSDGRHVKATADLPGVD